MRDAAHRLNFIGQHLNLLGRAAKRNREPVVVRVDACLRRALHYLSVRRQMGSQTGGCLALAVIYDTRNGAFETFHEVDVPALIHRLESADLVVGFNIRRFDYKVLRGYTDSDLSSLVTFDMRHRAAAAAGAREICHRHRHHADRCVSRCNGSGLDLRRRTQRHKANKRSR